MKNKKLDWFFKYIVNTIVLIILLTLAYKSLKYENSQNVKTDTVQNPVN